MNLSFLGDALDHWKGSLFESLQKSRIVREFAVDPMASDFADWKPDDYAILSKLLRINLSQIILHNHSLNNRRAYFNEIKHRGDLFLDPDTGVATGRLSVHHIAPAEIADLLNPTNRLLAIYQHIRAQRVTDRVDAVCAAIRAESPEVSWCSYGSSTVAMIFVSRKTERIASVYRHFGELLGYHAIGRIRASGI